MLTTAHAYGMQYSSEQSVAFNNASD